MASHSPRFPEGPTIRQVVRVSIQVPSDTVGAGRREPYIWQEAMFAQPVPVTAAGALAVSVIPHVTTNMES